ncbi:hypothetical protein DL89DRAFT_269225 [Linderina pennispora]|uniref:Uncharacterized protein n=1 Tax=Linderina pennispora TaxID=61395 RepID=A0A1Y1W2B2_9FUNG|nr:uncharacterized protein DL89DRAFT_269225 [Linderina pennispora]ORX67396.1 hypothetical protein DL89DRAFT_269225 [Linderina pennispora]
MKLTQFAHFWADTSLLEDSFTTQTQRRYTHIDISCIALLIPFLALPLLTALYFPPYGLVQQHIGGSMHAVSRVRYT